MYKSLIFFVLVAIAGGAVWYLNSQPDKSKSDSVIIDQLLASAKPLGVGSKSLPEAPPVERPTLSESGPFPKAVLNGISHDFGRMEVGEEDQYIFEIRNEGEADLEMTSGDTTCKCTTFGFGSDPETTTKKVTLKPGESTPLVIKWEAGEAPNRSFRHGGSVYTNDPEKTEIRYAVEGAIELSYELLPQVWTIGNVYDDQPGKFQGAIASKVRSSLEIESVTSKSGMVTATWRPMTSEDLARDSFQSGATLQLELSADVPNGAFEEDLEIRLVGRPNPITATVTARKHGQIRIQQMAGTLYDIDKALLQLGTFSVKDGREAKLLVIVDQKSMTEPLQIIDRTADPTFVTATLEPLGQPTGTVHRYVLTVSVPPGRPQVQRTTSRMGSIQLQTNHPSGESIKLSLLMTSH